MKTLQLSIVAVLLFVFGFTMLQVGKQSQLAAMRHAYSVCQTANSEINSASEKACGEAQDATHTEFVCGQVIVPRALHCWVEVK